MDAIGFAYLSHMETRKPGIGLAEAVAVWCHIPSQKQKHLNTNGMAGHPFANLWKRLKLPPPPPQPKPQQAQSNTPVPEFIITGGGQTITEGGSVTFYINKSNTATMTGSITLNITITGGDDFVPSNTLTVIVPSSGSKSFTVNTVQDSVDDPDSSVVTVALATGTGYTINSLLNSVTFTVQDDDAVTTPIPPKTVNPKNYCNFNTHSYAEENICVYLTLSSNSSSIIDEGDAITATVYTDRNVKDFNGLTINIAIADNNGYINGVVPSSIHIPRFKGKATFTLNTEDDNIDENDGVIKVSISPGAGYLLTDDGRNEFEINVRDNDIGPPPVITISSLGDITEGNQARFNVVATPTPKGPVVVYYTVSRTGDFDNYGGKVYLKAITKYDTLLSLDTVNDAADEPDGSITVTLQEDDEDGYDLSAYYTLSSTKAATVAVKDDDLSEANKLVENACVSDAMKNRVKYYISEVRRGAAHVLKWKNALNILSGNDSTKALEDLRISAKAQKDRGWSRWDEIHKAVVCMQGASGEPVLVLASDGNIVTEGNTASVTVSGSLAFSSPTDIALYISGDFVTDSPLTCQFPAGQTAHACAIVTNAANGTIDADGTFKVELKPGAGYILGDTNIVNIPVADADTPTITIKQIPGSDVVTEGGTASFNFYTTDTSKASSVKVKIVDGANFVSSGQAGTRTVNVGPGGDGGVGSISDPSVLTVVTDNDSVPESPSRITATIQQGSGYRVGAVYTTRVAVQDDSDGGSRHNVNSYYLEGCDEDHQNCNLVESETFTSAECFTAQSVRKNKYVLPSATTIENSAYTLNQIRGAGSAVDYGKRPTGSPHFPANRTKYAAEFVYPDGKDYFSEDEEVTVRFYVANYNPNYPNRDDNYEQPTEGYLCSKDKNGTIKKDSRWVNDWKWGPGGVQAPASQPTDFASTYESGPDGVIKVHPVPKDTLIDFTGGYGVPMNQNHIKFLVTGTSGVVRPVGLHDLHFSPGDLYKDYKFVVGANCRRDGTLPPQDRITNFNNNYDDGNKYFRHGRWDYTGDNTFRDPVGVYISDQRNYSCETGEAYGTSCSGNSGYGTPIYCMKPDDQGQVTLSSFGVSGNGGSWAGNNLKAKIRPKAAGEDAFVVEGYVKRITEGHPLTYFITTHDGQEPKQGGTIHLKATAVAGGAPFENDQKTKVVDIPITIGNGWFSRAAPYNGGFMFQDFLTDDDSKNEGDSIVRLEVAEGNEFPIRFANGEGYFEYTVLDNEAVTLNSTLTNNGISETSGTATLTVKLPEGTVDGDDADMIVDILPAPYTYFHNHIDWTDPSGNGDKRQTATIEATGCASAVPATEAAPYFRCVVSASTAAQSLTFTFRALPQGDESDDRNPGHTYDLGFHVGHYQEAQSLQPQYEITGTRDEYKTLDGVLSVAGDGTDFTGANAIKVQSVPGIFGNTGIDSIVMGAFKGNYGDGQIPSDATPLANITFSEPASNDESLLNNGDTVYIAFKRTSSNPEQSKVVSTTFDVAFNHGTAIPGKDFRVYSYDPRKYCKGSASFTTNAQGRVIAQCDGTWSTDTRDWHSYDYGRGVSNSIGDRVTVGRSLNEWVVGFKLVPMRDNLDETAETVIGRFFRKSISSAKGVYHSHYTKLQGEVNATLENAGAGTVQNISNVQVTIPDVTAPEGTPTKFTMTVNFPSNQNGCLTSKLDTDALWAYPTFLQPAVAGKAHVGKLVNQGDFLIGNTATDNGLQSNSHRFADTRFKICSTNTKKAITRDFYIYAHSDGINDNGETAKLKLQVPSYTSGGKKYDNKVTVTNGTLTITNDGPLPKEWIARFGHVVASETVEAVSDRVRADRKPGSSSLSFGAMPGEEVAITQGSEIVEGSSFHITSAERDGATLSAWGKVSTSSFDASVTDMDLDSDNTHAMLGIDYAAGSWLVGVGVGLHNGEGGAEMLGEALVYDIESKVSNVFPYGSITVGSTKVWSTIGYGTGEISIRQELGSGEKSDLGTADTEWWMAATGLRSTMFDAKHYSMAIVGDVFWTSIESGEGAGYRAAEAESHRERLGLEVDMDFDRLSFTPSIFARADGGDVGSGTGIELNASVSWETLEGLFLTGSGSHVLDSDNEFNAYAIGAEWQTGFGRPSVSWNRENYSLGWSREFSGGVLGINTIPDEQAMRLDLSLRF